MSKFTETIKTGAKKDQLQAIRDLLAERLEAAPASAVPNTARELVAVIKELGYTEVTREGSKADELAQRRADRIARSQNQ